MKKSKQLLHDPVIINRVKQYLEENVDKTYLDVGVMTKQLMDRYPEYARRKLQPFRALVEQAYRIVSQSYGMESQPSSGDDSDGSDLEVMDDTSPNNLMSNLMNNLYTKQKDNITPKASSTKQPAAEAIDISSDDDSGAEVPADTNGKSQEKNIASLPVGNTFRDVTVSKFPITESALKGSSGTVHLNPVSASDAAAASHKRHGNDYSEEQQQQPHPPHKKQKSDTSTVTTAVHQQRQHRNVQRIANFHEQGSESGGVGNGGAHYAVGGSGGGGGGLRPQQRQRKYKKEIQLRKSRETFQDIGGMEKTLKELCELLMHIKSPDIYFVLGLMPPRGILLHGPPGCGKTLLAHAIAGQLNLALIEIPATELIAGISGESEERIRDVFEQAETCAPCVLFIDEIDAISSNRSLAQKDMERRVVSQLISSLDNLKMSEGGQSVLVIGATTRPDVLDPALRRVGRFDHEIPIGIPTRKDRKDILSIICDGLSVEPKCDFDKIAELTPGYVGADLLALVSRAATIAVKRKCTEQIREFQLNAQRNITIVELDDDAEENNDDADKADKSKVSKEAQNKAEQRENTTKDTNRTEKEKSTVAKEGEIEDAITADKLEPELNGTTNKNEKKEPDPATVPEAIEVDGDQQKTAEDRIDGDANNDDSAAQLKVSQASDNQQSKKIDDKVNTDAGKTAVVQKKVEKDTAAEISLNLPEPSLFELLNWLDNPPEDITFVSDFCITLDDFCDAVKVVQPSAKREGFITVPDVTWDDIGSLQDIREELKLAVLAPVKFPEKLIHLGLSAPSGVLLCGPPGCGKTLLAKAIANEAGINFIAVKGPELMNMYVGESERAVRACFQRARNSAPCVIFFDEFDSLCPKRSESNEGGSGTRVVNQLLTEMDGVEDRKGVYILAATNRPDIIDPAILRPGRLDTILYVGLPQQKDRLEILNATTKNRTRPVLDDDVDFENLSKKTDGYTGADLAGLVRQAAMLALKESLNNADLNLDDLRVRREHFEKAIKLLRPSVSVQDRKVYDKLRLKYAAPRVSSAIGDGSADVE